MADNSKSTQLLQIQTIFYCIYTTTFIPAKKKKKKKERKLQTTSSYEKVNLLAAYAHSLKLKTILW